MKTIITTFLLGMAMVTHATIHIILVGQNGLTFSPSTLSVAIGDTVRYTYVSSGSHTTTSTSVPANAATWTSPMNTTVTQFDYVVTKAGDYQYQCNPHVSAGMKGSFSATVTGIDSKFSGIINSFSIAPNPTADKTTLSFSSASAFRGSLKIFDSRGDLVYDEKVKIDIGENQILLNTEKMLSGIYYINLLNQNDSFLVSRLIKK